MIYESFSPEETRKIAFDIAENAKESAVFCLTGDLGAGKTVFAKGFAEGLGINEHITSPTFTIFNIYNGRIPLYHFDMYRIEDEDELYNLGVEEYFYGKGICLIEWPEMAMRLIPTDAAWISIKKDINKSEDYRKIEINFSKPN